jgi:hypothetical protein
MANVSFRTGTRAQYDKLNTKDPNTLYWLTDTQELLKGELLYGKGSEATALAAGLLSADDKRKLDELSAGSANDLVPVDATIILSDSESGEKQIGVRISAQDGNAISALDDGLFVPVPAAEIAVDEENANGLFTSENGLMLSLATEESAGAMSAVDKVLLGSLQETVEALDKCLTWEDI